MTGPRARPGTPLSPRELQLALLLVDRAEPQLKHAAAVMGVALETAETMRSRAYTKTGAHTRLGLLYALVDAGHTGLLPPAPVDDDAVLRRVAEALDAAPRPV